MRSLLKNNRSPYYALNIRNSQRPHHFLAEAENLAVAAIRDQRHVPRLPRLEPHRGSGRDIEPHAARLVAIEFQRRVGLEEMIMRADLDRPVAGIRHGESHAGAASVDRDLAFL